MLHDLDYPEDAALPSHQPEDPLARRETAFALSFTKEELQVFDTLKTPERIQAFLLDLQYSAEERYRSPRTVIVDRIAHCFDGCLFGAAALRYIGYPPLIVELLPTDRDDDHLLAVYKVRGAWGAVAKSNFAGLTYREPVYRNLRELVMSYFEQYYNVTREKTLRGYTVPLNLRPFDRVNWMGSDEGLEAIALRLEDIRKIRLITTAQARCLSLLDERSYQAGLIGANEAGLYKPDLSA
jgi:hypothetical protein